MMYSEALRILGDSADAEDAVQDVYVRLWERSDELVQVDNIRAYVMAMVRNRCISLLGSPRRAVVADTDGGKGLRTAHAGFADEVEIRDRVRSVMELIGTLPGKQRQVIMMHDVEGRSNEEIERSTGLSADNVRQLLSRARRAVRSHFSKD